jgi:hypothetical protein
MGCVPQTLHEWVKKTGVDSGKRAGVPTDLADKLKALERENRELRQANEILRKASAYFAQAEFYRPIKRRSRSFVPDLIRVHRGSHGVEPTCKALPIAPSTYHGRAAKLDLVLEPAITRVCKANIEVYGVRKVWRHPKRENIDVDRRAVARLMREKGLHGVFRNEHFRTTISDKAAPCPLDHVNRQFHAPAPNSLWVSDFNCVSTWRGLVYAAFAIEVYARYVVGWRVSRTANAGFVLDALEQAIHDRSQSIMAAWSITVTAAASVSRSNTPCDWRRLESSRRLAAFETAMTTLPLRRSTAFTKRSDP